MTNYNDAGEQHICKFIITNGKLIEMLIALVSAGMGRGPALIQLYSKFLTYYEDTVEECNILAVINSTKLHLLHHGEPSTNLQIRTEQNQLHNVQNDLFCQ